jgi:hypothetical protein
MGAGTFGTCIRMLPICPRCHMLAVSHVVLPQRTERRRISVGQARALFYVCCCKMMPPLSPYLDTAIHKHGPQCGITHVSLPCYIVRGCMLHDMRRWLKREKERVSLTWPVLGRSRQDSCSLNIGRCRAFLHYAQLGRQHLGQVQVSICPVLERWRRRRSDGLFSWVGVNAGSPAWTWFLPAWH